MDEVREFWDEIARHEYEHANERVSRVHTQRFRGALRRLHLEPGMRVLNIWSRTGDGIPFFRGACPEIMLVNAELSGRMLDVSRADNPEEMHVQTSLHELPFVDDSFDTVISLETLEHVPDPFLFLEEMNRVTKPGGRVVLSLPPSAAEWTSALNRLLRFHHGEGPHRFLAPRIVKEMLDEAGFELVDHSGSLFLPFGGMGVERFDDRLSGLFGSGPVAQLGLRQFYVCETAG
jgi:ubiquinone/menaquinone biosynthesis C-methylase UbiE